MLKAGQTIQKKIFDRYQPGIWLITIISFLNSFSTSFSFPFLALYLYEKREVSMSMIGLIMLVSGTAPAVGQLFAGALADKIGRRPLLIISILSGVVLYTGMAYTIGLNAPVIFIILMFLVVRTVLWMQRPVIAAVVMDLTPIDRLTETYGLQRIGGNLGWAAGPALGGFLAGSLSYGWLFGIAGLIGIINLILIIFFFQESFSRTSERLNIKSIFGAVKDKNLLIFSVLSLIICIVAGQMSSTLSVYTVSYSGLSKTQYGSLLTLNGLIIVIFQYPVTLMLKKMKMQLALVLGALFYGAGYFLFAWVGPYGLAVGAMTLVTSGEIMIAPLSSSIVGEMASPNWRGRYMAFYGLSDAMGMAIGPLIGGMLLDAFPGQPLLVWGPMLVLALASAIGFSRFRVKQTASKLNQNI
jgi:predicted MFS family arabinose efflux permease